MSKDFKKACAESALVVAFMVTVACICALCSLVDRTAGEGVPAKGVPAAERKKEQVAEISKAARPGRKARPTLEGEGLKETEDDRLEDLLDEITDDEDWPRMKKLARSLTAGDEWTEKLSEDAQSNLLDALSDFGAKALPEMVGFLASPYENVREDALNAIDGTLQDMEEKDAAESIAMMARVVTDEDAIAAMLAEIDSFEPENAAAAILGIAKDGTPEFKEALKEELDDLLEREADDPVFAEGEAFGFEKAEAAVLKWLDECREEKKDE